MLDSWARMNTRGVGEGNWAWRFKASDLGKQLSDRLLETSKLYGRYTPIPEKKDSELRSNHTTSQINAGTFKIA